MVLVNPARQSARGRSTAASGGDRMSPRETLASALAAFVLVALVSWGAHTAAGGRGISSSLQGRGEGMSGAAAAASGAAGGGGFVQHVEDRGHGGARKVWFSRPGGSPLQYEEVISLWRESEGFREEYISALRNAPFAAFFWETPPITLESASTTPFEMVMLRAEGLEGVSPDQDTFSEQLLSCRDSAEDGRAVAFPNLGGDAQLVAPCKVSEPEHYAHMAAFVRGAPGEQVHAFWRRVGGEASRRLEERSHIQHHKKDHEKRGHPTWVSTNGMGVSWLHVRMDTHPKYYQHGEYREWPFATTVDFFI